MAMKLIIFFASAITLCFFGCKAQQKNCVKTNDKDIQITVCYKHNFIEYTVSNLSSKSIYCDTADIMRNIVQKNGSDTLYYSYSNYNYGADRGGIELIAPISEVIPKSLISKKIYLTKKEMNSQEINFMFYYVVDDNIKEKFSRPELLTKNNKEISSMDFTNNFKSQSVNLKLKQPKK